jgi:carbon-monoxide dehydrogenase large subunit
VAHGVGETLYERIVYDEQGQLLTSTFKDYLLLTAVEAPDVEIEHVETLSPLNPLGAKGAGEGGVIPVAAALTLAVQDALSPLGVTVYSTPIVFDRLRQAIEHRGPSRRDAAVRGAQAVKRAQR